MGVTLRAAVEAGRAAWLANLTIAEKAWPERQLYTLYRMLLENREDLLEVCNRDFSHEPIFWEREFASLVEDIGALILSLEAPTTPAIGKSHFGTFTTSLRPRGVSLILSTSKNPLRFVLAPLAASIAARNVVILGTTRLDKFWVLIEQKVLNHLDTFAIQVVVATLSDISPEHFDQIYIIAEDEDREKYSDLIKLPHVSWHQASGAFKVAVVDGGPLNVSSCASEISTKHDQLTSVIVQDEHFNSLCDAICKCMVNAGSNTKTMSLDLPKCRRLTSIFYTIDWMGSATQSSTPDLHFLLQTAQRAGAVLLLKSSSLEQCLDSLCQISNIAQATLLNPRSKEHERYFQDWARSSVVAFRSIPSSVPEVITYYSGATTDHPITTFPPALFAITHVEVVECVSGTADTPRAIRQSYESRFPVPKQEAPGGRIDFFVQVDCALKAVGSVLGLCVLVGAWYTHKAVRTSYFSA